MTSPPTSIVPSSGCRTSYECMFIHMHHVYGKTLKLKMLKFLFQQEANNSELFAKSKAKMSCQKVKLPWNANPITLPSKKHRAPQC